MLHTIPDGEVFRATLPDLPKGQSQERIFLIRIPCFQLLAATWIVILLLCLAWAVRKKIHLDWFSHEFHFARLSSEIFRRKVSEILFITPSFQLFANDRPYGSSLVSYIL